MKTRRQYSLCFILSVLILAGILTAFTVNVGAININAESISIDNKGYPYGSNLSSSIMTLTVDVIGVPTEYQWQTATDPNGEFSDIDGANGASYAFTPVVGNWYRCVVTGTNTVTSEAVQIVNPNWIYASSCTTYNNNYFVSNGYEAYTIKVEEENGIACTHFDIIGKAGSSWIGTSYDNGWQVATSANPDTVNGLKYTGGTEPHYKTGAALDSIKLYFDPDEEFCVYVKADLADNQTAFAFGTDVKLGNVDSADLAAIKKNGVLTSVQLDNGTQAMVIDLSAQTPSCYFLGYYAYRLAWVNGTQDIVTDGTDSGMAVSWLNLTNNNDIVEFAFRVGTMEDTGAKNNYTVTFHSNGGSGSMNSQVFLEAEAQALNSNTFTNEGYSFNGWNTAADGSGTGYADRDSITLTSNVTLYAQWVPDAFTVTWVDENGVTVDTEEVNNGGSATKNPAVPAKIGYTGYWDKTANSVTGDVTIQAVYRINRYSIYFDTNGGSVMDPITLDYGSSVTVPAEPTKPHKVFAGWVDEDGNPASIPNNMPAEDVTLLATWVSANYIVTFDPMGGECDVLTMATDEYKLPALPEAYRFGYFFNGWSTEEINGELVDPNAEYYEDTTLYAQYTYFYDPYKTQHRVNVESTVGGDVTASHREAFGNTIITLKVNTDDGYRMQDLTVKADYYTLKLKEEASGVYTFVMPYKPVVVNATFQKVETDPIAPEDEACDGGENCPAWSYSDVIPTEWYHEAVDYVLENDLMIGKGNGLFDVNGATTRAQIVTILWRLEGEPVVNYAMSFCDVDGDAWYAEAIRWAAAEGIVEGYEDNTFRPDRAVTREQMAAILYRYEENNGGGFKGLWMYNMDFADLADVADWAFEAVAWCNMNDVLTGKPGNLLDPQGTTKRSESAAILMRYIEE